MTPQQTIAHYRITGKLGEGGMGAVYRAIDTKLNRDVAIKVLPDSFAADPDRLARFTREAQVLASLNHPNIAAIYGVEERAIVMELVDGQEIKGPLPLDTALNYAGQIADALEAAHEKGIVHRDLKPANIKVTPQGVVKVLDFGLAKIAEPAASASTTISPTLTINSSEAGPIMGTAAYMSPEQARGQAVDKRADIWAFGVILWELLTGRRMFEGATVSDVLAAVLKNEPDLEAVPPQVRRSLARCLEKDPRKRLRDIGDWRDLLTSESTSRRPASRLPWIAAALLGAATIIFAALWLRRPVEEVRPLRFTIPPPENATFDTSSMAVSPDGRRIAFVAEQDGSRRIWVRDLDAPSSRLLPGTDGVATGRAELFWSPDSRFLAFFASGKLKKVDVTAGPPLTLCDAPNARGGSWSARDVIVFGTQGAGGTGLMRVPASGGTPAPVTQLDASAAENTHRWPSFLPDGRHVLFFARTLADEKRAIWVGDLDSKDRRLAIKVNSNSAYDPRGFLLFVRDGTLMAQPWDAARVASTGEAFPVAEQVEFAPNNSLAHFSISQTGVLAYFSGSSGGMQLTWLDRSGKPLGTVGPPGLSYGPAISPKGDIIAADRIDPQAGNSDIWMHDIVHGTDSRFTFDPGFESYPTWSPDGSRIAFSFGQTGKSGIAVKPSSGAGQAELVLAWPTVPYLSDWSRDGKYLIFRSQSPQTGVGIYVLPNPLGNPAGRKHYAFLQINGVQAYARISPDGKWLAYQSDESHENQIYVLSFPGKEAKFQISSQGGTHPLWSRDGKELFFLAPGGKVMAVDVKSAATFEHGHPKQLFEARIPPGPMGWDISPDVQRFLMPLRVSDTPSTGLNVVVNWSAGIKK